MSGDPRHQAVLDNYLGGAESVTYKGSIRDGVHRYDKENGFFIMFDDYLGIDEADVPVQENKKQRKTSKNKHQRDPDALGDDNDDDVSNAPASKKQQGSGSPVTRDEVQEILDRSIIRFIKHIKKLTEKHAEQNKPVLTKAFDELIASWSMSRPEERELASSVLSKLRGTSQQSPVLNVQAGFEDRAEGEPITAQELQNKQTSQMLKQYINENGIKIDSPAEDDDEGAATDEEENDENRSGKGKKKGDDDDELSDLVSPYVDPASVY